MDTNGSYTAENRQEKWDTRFMEMARLVAHNSKDRSKQVGCVVVDSHNAVVSTGYNGFPRGVDDNREERHERPTKYLYTVHAEANAVADAARRGCSLLGTTAYVPWFPCAGCAGLLIQAGVKTLVCYKPVETQYPLHSKWGPEFKAALVMLGEAHITVRYLEGQPIEVTP
jgi:dCMP deaminase